MLVGDKTEIDAHFSSGTRLSPATTRGCAGGTKKFISPDAREQQRGEQGEEPELISLNYASKS
jgi:hypothetical protein